MKKPGRTTKPRLPDAELEVLACLERHGEATANDVRAALASFRPLSHGSVMTLLGRLEAKRLVVRRKGEVGKAFLYRATDGAASALAHVPRTLLARVFGGDPVLLVSSLFEGAPPDHAEIDALQTLLDQLRERATAEGE